MSPGARGVFVTFEGLEGSGKSTQISLLRTRLREGGVAVVVTREPGGTALGRRLRAILLESPGAPIAPVTEMLLYAADRAQHVTEVLLPALERRAVVLCDRYLDATLAYQGEARGLGAEAVLRLHARSPLDLRPDRTVLLDMEPAEALARARGRNERRGSERDEGRFEAETLDFHRRVREAYLDLARAEPERFRIVPASGEASQVHARVARALADALPLERREGGS